MGTTRTNHWPLILMISLFWLTGCGLGTRTEPVVPPSPTPTIIATFTAVAPLAAQQTPTDTPEPTATTSTGSVQAPRPTATATTPPPTSTPQPTSIPTLTADQREADLLPALSFRDLNNEFRYPMQRVTWEYGLRSSDYCQHGPYRWLTNDHLLLYPLIGQTAWFEITTMGEATWPVVANLNGQPAWGMANPPTDICDLPVWSAARQQLIEVITSLDGTMQRHEITLRDLSGEMVATYAGQGPLHLAPSGQRLLAGNQWLDLENGRSVELPEWDPSPFHVPGWTADETRLFTCCFSYADTNTGAGWSGSLVPFAGRGSWPGEATYSNILWVPGETHAMLSSGAVFPLSESSEAIVPLIEPAARSYQDLAEVLDLEGIFVTCAIVSPVGNFALLTCGQETAYLVDLVSLETVSVIEDISHMIAAIRWSANGRFLTYTEFDDDDRENGRVWLLTTDGERRQLSDEPASRVWWHPTEPLLALRLDDPQRLRLVQAETGQERSLEMLDPVEDLVWQPDVEGLALQTADNRLWWLSRPFQPLPYYLPTVPIPLTAPSQGETLHSLRWSPDGTRLAYVHDNHLSVITVDAGPQTVYAGALDFAIDLPPRWTFYEVDGMPMFTSDERFGDWPTPMHYFVYAQEYPNPEERPFVELVTADLGDGIQANFSYTTGTIGPYTVHRSDGMPSMSGALTVFFELPDRYLALALTPYDSEQPYQDQERYRDLFETMLRSVIVDR
jgi:hypothetical protein